MIYVTSDIHGNMERYRSLMSKIDLKSDDKLYILGDVVDRYPGGIKLLLEIMEAENIKMLLGNHEYMMLMALKPPVNSSVYDITQNVRCWHSNGGTVTQDAFMHESLESKNRIIHYLEQLPINIDLEVNGQKYKLVHATSVTRYPYRVFITYLSYGYSVFFCFHALFLCIEQVRMSLLFLCYADAICGTYSTDTP